MYLEIVTNRQVAGIRSPEVTSMSKLDKLVGERFGQIVVVEKAYYKWKGAYLCECDCGNRFCKSQSNLKVGGEYNCGKPSCRFWAKVNKDGPIVSEELGPCYLWTGGTHNNGYGGFRIATRAVCKAHVFGWSEVNGPVPEGMVLRHMCNTRLCVRPDHLVPGTHKENMRDMVDSGRSSKVPKRLSTEEKDRLRVDAKNGFTYPQLAMRYNIDPRSVGRILNGR